MNAPQLYLASGSPRRRELLQQLGLSFQVLPVDVDERPRAGEDPAAYVLRVARDKAEAGLRAAGREAERPVLAADTAVVLEGRILGKPRGRGDALQMLAALSDREHWVFSGVAVHSRRRRAEALSRTRVRFGPVPPQVAEAYWETGEPVDKAGAYAIQGRGAVFVARIDGSYSGVMGLPLYETADLLAAFGVAVLG